MPTQIAFQSSLPRAGSTLFSNIVGKNPAFHVTPTSGLLDLLYLARGQFSRGEQFKAQGREEMERAFIGFCRGGLEGYATALTDKPWLLDKSRGWGVHYGFLNAFYPNPKIICMLRDLLDILCSMERNFRKAGLRDPGMVNHSEMLNTSLEKRLDHWVVLPPVGLAMERLQEILRQGIDQQMLFITMRISAPILVCSWSVFTPISVSPILLATISTMWSRSLLKMMRSMGCLVTIRSAAKWSLIPARPSRSLGRGCVIGFGSAMAGFMKSLVWGDEGELTLKTRRRP